MKSRTVAAYRVQNCAVVSYKDHCHACSYLNMLLNDLRLGQNTKVTEFEDDTKFIDSESIKRAQRFITIKKPDKIWTENIRMEMQLAFSCEIFIWEKNNMKYRHSMKK